MKVKKNRQSVSFVLPGLGYNPAGGFKIVYEYANRLSEHGFDVHVIHLAWLYKTSSLFKGIARYFFGLFIYPFCSKWFVLNKNIKNKWLFTPVQFLFPKTNYVIATSWETAEYINKFKPQYGKKLYLIQGNESDFFYVQKAGYQKRVIDTWKMDFSKIAISSILERLLGDMGHRSTKIYNGLSFSDFFMEIHYADRNVNTVMMLYHDSPQKGTKDGLTALRSLKQRLPDLQVILFGTPSKPAGLEKWIQYYQKPGIEQLRTLYNTATVFISPSHLEGWGLPASEAMQCGCAVVTTDIDGFKDFVIDNETALCSKVGDAEDLCNKMYLLLTNKEMRIRIAESGYSYIKRFTWESSVSKFIETLNQST